MLGQCFRFRVLGRGENLGLECLSALKGHPSQDFMVRALTRNRVTIKSPKTGYVWGLVLLDPFRALTVRTGFWLRCMLYCEYIRESEGMLVLLLTI